MAEVLVDTDVFIDHLRGQRELEPGRDHLSYSAVTRAELFAGRNTNEDVVRTLLAPFGELPVDREVAELGGRIRRDLSIGLPDALIAATAIGHRLVLMTRNARDFERVPGLRLREPS